MLLISAAALSACGSTVTRRSQSASSEREQLSNDTAIVYPDVVPEFVLTYADNQTENYPTTQGGYRFAQLVNEKTNGRIRVRVNAGGVLGEETSTVEQLTMGGIDFVRVSLATIEDYSDMAQTLMMPYLYNDADHMWRVLSGSVGTRVMASIEGTGMEPLSWYVAGVRDFYFREPVHTLEDMQGLRIRVQMSDVMEDMVEQLGAQAVPLSYEEIYSALETGQVDGAENNWSSYETMNHNEVAPYFLLDEHIRIPELQLISSGTLRQLTQEDQKAIREAARESSDYERQLWTENETRAQDKVVREGTQVISLSGEEKEKFRQAVEPLYPRYCGNYMDIIEAIRKEGNS